MTLLLIPHSTNASCSCIWSLLLIQHWYIKLMTLVDLHSDAGQVLCTSCGEPCISRTANTEANRGRKFYKCHDPGCGFFKYVKFMDPLYCIMLSCNVHILSVVAKCKPSYLYTGIRVSIYYWSHPVSSTVWIIFLKKSTVWIIRPFPPSPEICLGRRWEDELEAATPRGRRGRGSSRQAPASAGRRGRGRRGRGRNADGGMFVSATGDPVSGCCFTCGDPTHFANACPNRRS
jgi:hypothetical protein